MSFSNTNGRAKSASFLPSAINVRTVEIIASFLVDKYKFLNNDPFCQSYNSDYAKVLLYLFFLLFLPSKLQSIDMYNYNRAFLELSLLMLLVVTLLVLLVLFLSLIKSFNKGKMNRSRLCLRPKLFDS